MGCKKGQEEMNTTARAENNSRQVAVVRPPEPIGSVSVHHGFDRTRQWRMQDFSMEREELENKKPLSCHKIRFKNRYFLNHIVHL